MIFTQFRLAIVTALGAFAFAGLAAAEPMPSPGDRQWLSVGGTYCFNPTPNGTPTCPGGGTASGSIPSATDFTHPFWAQQGVVLLGGGSTSANALRVYLESNNGFGRATAVIADRYYVSGPAGSIQIGVIFTAEGSFDIIPTQVPNVVAGQGVADIKIGSAMSPDGKTLISEYDSEGIITGFINGLAHIEFDLLATHTLTVAAGSYFDLAFLLNIGSTLGVRGNAMNTALIDFVLPEGYTLTSELGWTSPSASVSEPGALAVIGSALFAIRLLRRRRAA